MRGSGVAPAWAGDWRRAGRRRRGQRDGREVARGKGGGREAHGGGEPLVALLEGPRGEDAGEGPAAALRAVVALAAGGAAGVGGVRRSEGVGCGGESKVRRVERREGRPRRSSAPDEGGEHVRPRAAAHQDLLAALARALEHRDLRDEPAQGSAAAREPPQPAPSAAGNGARSFGRRERDRAPVSERVARLRAAFRGEEGCGQAGCAAPDDENFWSIRPTGRGKRGEPSAMHAPDASDDAHHARLSAALHVCKHNVEVICGKSVRLSPRRSEGLAQHTEQMIPRSPTSRSILVRRRPRRRWRLLPAEEPGPKNSESWSARNRQAGNAHRAASDAMRIDGFVPPMMVRHVCFVA